MSFTVLKPFPKQLSLEGFETEVIIRPLEPEDAGELLEFFGRVPEEERFYLKEDVTDPRVVDGWAQDIDYNRVMPLVGLLDNKIVADGTLHRHRAGARRHIGEVRIVVDPEHRRRGLGTLMLRELVDIAYDNAMDGVVMELIDGVETDAIEIAKGLGFQQLAVMPNFAKDAAGEPHDLLVLHLVLDDWLEDQ